MLINDHALVSLLCMFTVKSIFTRFNGQSFGEETENLKKILEKRKVDEILNFLQQSPSSTQIYCFQVILRSFFGRCTFLISVRRDLPGDPQRS